MVTPSENFSIELSHTGHFMLWSNPDCLWTYLLDVVNDAKSMKQWSSV